jgi:FixJ family two-component response regulator
MDALAKAKLVAVVEDDESVRLALGLLLESDGLSVATFESAEDFLNSAERPDVACLIVDIRLPGMSGLELQAKLNAQRSRLPTIFMTAHGDGQIRMQAMRQGAVEFFTKPFDDQVLLNRVQSALEG